MNAIGAAVDCRPTFLVKGECTMASHARPSVRQPATKFANLRKKMEKNKVVKGIANRRKK
jgi:hypothetical protein